MTNAQTIKMTNLENLISYMKKYSRVEIGEECTAKDGQKYRYDSYYLLAKSAPAYFYTMFNKAQAEAKLIRKQESYRQILTPTHSFHFYKPEFKGEPNGTASMSELIILY